MAKLDAIARSIKDKQLLNKIFLGLMGLVELIILIPIVLIIIRCFNSEVSELYSLLALLILLVWFGGLGAYYAWAIYFYNINLGLTNEDWAEIRERKKHSPEGTIKIPTENPNINQTLGLPTGTIRGTLALTLMIGALALTIAALGMENSLRENTFLIDNFDFFKTAFLMMIAFYFGNKSLELLSKNGKTTNNTGDNRNDTTRQQQTLTQSAPVPPAEDASMAKQILKKGKEIFSTYRKKKADAEDGDFDYPGAVQ